MITTDLAPPTSATLARISDTRVVQYWDPDRAVSTYLVSLARAHPGWSQWADGEPLDDDFIIWDAALVFPAGNQWDSMLPPPSSYGGPVVDVLDMIRTALSQR